MMPFSAHHSADVSSELNIREGDGLEDDLVCFYIEGDGVAYMDVGRGLAAVLLSDIPGGMGVFVVPFDIAVKIEGLVGSVDRSVRKIDSLAVEVQRDLQGVCCNVVCVDDGIDLSENLEGASVKRSVDFGTGAQGQVALCPV